MTSSSPEQIEQDIEQTRQDLRDDVEALKDKLSPTGAAQIGTADALGYGIILQAVEMATAVIMGAPALVKEGVSWREIRLRALHTTPVELSSRPAQVRAGARS